MESATCSAISYTCSMTSTNTVLVQSVSAIEQQKRHWAQNRHCCTRIAIVQEAPLSIFNPTYISYHFPSYLPFCFTTYGILSVVRIRSGFLLLHAHLSIHRHSLALSHVHSRFHVFMFIHFLFHVFMLRHFPCFCQFSTFIPSCDHSRHAVTYAHAS